MGLSDYIGNFGWDLKETQAWIVAGGFTAPVTDVPPQIVPLIELMQPAPSDGESEVSGSDEELPTLKQLLSKVKRADNIEHVLDKGAWATMPMTHWGWEIFVGVSRLCIPFHPLLIFVCPGPAGST